MYFYLLIKKSFIDYYYDFGSNMVYSIASILSALAVSMLCLITGSPPMIGAIIFLNILFILSARVFLRKIAENKTNTFKPLVITIFSFNCIALLSGITIGFYASSTNALLNFIGIVIILLIVIYFIAYPFLICLFSCDEIRRSDNSYFLPGLLLKHPLLVIYTSFSYYVSIISTLTILPGIYNGCHTLYNCCKIIICAEKSESSEKIHSSQQQVKEEETIESLTAKYRAIKLRDVFIPGKN